MKSQKTIRKTKGKSLKQLEEKHFGKKGTKKRELWEWDRELGITKEYEKGGDENLATVQALRGSLIIPPNRLKKIFRDVFNMGIECDILHPNDDIAKDIYFYEALKNMMESFRMNKKYFPK